MTQHSRYLITVLTGEELDLTTAKELRSNNLYPFGLHNYAIYCTQEGVHVKATNTGNPHLMLNQYEIIDEATAKEYKHPHRRIED